MEKLLALQEFQLQTKALSVESKAKILKLRESVPAPILVHFDRLIARGQRAVALARNGVCTECHLRITSGTLAGLAGTTNVHLCDNCGRYLFLPENELLSPTDSPPIKATAKSHATRTRQKGI
jgi:predicted  nucleic acid-binding Zn-ribbon protein